MADHQQTAGPTLQLLIQSLSVLTIEMIGGFIQYQKVGFRQKSAHQSYAHGFATTERRSRCRRIQVGESVLLQLVEQLLTNVPLLSYAVKVRLDSAALPDTLKGTEDGLHACQIGQGPL